MLSFIDSFNIFYWSIVNLVFQVYKKWFSLHVYVYMNLYFFFFFRLFSIMCSFNFIEHFLQPFCIKKILIESLLKYRSLHTHDLLLMFTPSNRQNKGGKKLSLTIFPVWNLFFFPLPRRICNRNCMIPIEHQFREIYTIAKPEPTKELLYVTILL